MRVIFAGLFCCLFTCPGFSQTANTKPDTILLQNGKTIACTVTDTSGEDITYEKLSATNHKKKEINREEVFSIRYGSTGKEVVTYIHDTLIGNDFTVAEARQFIAGEQDAQRGFRPVGTNIGAFVVGFASGLTGASFLVLGPPFLYSGLMAWPRVKIRHKSVTNMSNVKADPYLYGYDVVARKKRVLQSILWGAVGVVGGFIFNISGELSYALNSGHL